MVYFGRRAALSAALTCAVALTARGQTTVNFDAFTGMPNSPGSAVPAPSQLSTQLLSSGVRFSSLSDYIAVVVLGTGHATSGTLGIGGTAANGTLSYAAPIRATFWDPANSATLGVTNFVQIRGDLIPIAGTITMRVFDPLGALLATVTLPDGGGTTLTYSGANVHSVEITGTSATVAFDDFQFGAVRAIDGVTVPEPTALGLFAGGALLLAGASRYRRRTAARV
jgi:hypothetical protein